MEALRTNFAGELLTPQDGGYDEARKIWNGNIDRRPALLARCTGVADVIAGHASQITSPLSTIPIFTLGGAVARDIPPDAEPRA
jgi:hypothetical protein